LEAKLTSGRSSFNEEVFLRFKVEQAKYIIKKSYEMFGRKLAVAFSGGKDSLAVLHLTIQSIGNNVKVIYNHTTVEFPETIKYVKRLADEWSFELVIATPKRPFFKAVKEVGWATHENRWCCRPYKEEPAYEVMAHMGIAAEVTGTRRTESLYRRHLKPMMHPKKDPHLIRIHPIYDWNDAEVWGYIKMNSLPHNPLYDMGYRRIGCWCCPLNGLSHYARLKKTHPQLFDFLLKFKPLHPCIARLIGVQGSPFKPEYTVQPCTEGKEMLHVTFLDRGLGQAIAKELIDMVEGVEIHENGTIICVPSELRELLDKVLERVKSAASTRSQPS
jgi:phosphoadenylyl-sulfate reductase (thioredoxin)